MFTNPEMFQQAEISAYDLKAAEIFRMILEDGEPKTSYDLIFKKNLPTATVHRHLKRMIEDKAITIYGKGHLRKKKPYGPTFYGLISYYGVDKELTKNLEQYFEMWKDNQDFRAAIEQLGFDERKMKTHNDECKKMFRIWIETCARCEEAYDKLAEDPYKVPYEVQQFLGGILLSGDKKLIQHYEELYAFSKPFRIQMDTMFTLVMARNIEIRKNAKKLMKKWD